MLHAPPPRADEAGFVPEPAGESVDETPARRAWWAWPLALAFLGVTGALAYQSLQRTAVHQPAPRVAEPPAINPAIERAVLGAIAPGWPAKHPSLDVRGTPIEAVEGHVTGLAAADLDGEGHVVWGVSYAWLGPVEEDGARVARPGFAIVTATDQPALVFLGPPTGGWDDARQGAFEATSEVEATVETVRPAPRELGFLYRYTAESSRGGHLTHGRARLFELGSGLWRQAWEGETETRWRTGHSDERATSMALELVDRDGDGVAEIVATPSHYYRHLDAQDHGTHFMAEGPGSLIYRREGGQYRLAALAVPGHPDLRIRPAPPLYAVRAPGPVVVDGEFDDWDSQELAELSGIHFDDPALMKYKRRDPAGLDDLGGEVKLMWDQQALYVRADVMDNVVVPGPPGPNLYQGDNLSIWLDMDLQKDFDNGLRDGDDWQLGLSPGAPGAVDAQGHGLAEAWCWVPKSGRNGILVASKPLLDPFTGTNRGYQLEAAIPWANLGGLPPGLVLKPPSQPMAAPMGTEPRHYHLALAGAVGIGLVLSDADTEYQELGYASNVGFTWAEPKTFNTLLLVEPQ